MKSIEGTDHTRASCSFIARVRSRTASSGGRPRNTRTISRTRVANANLKIMFGLFVAILHLEQNLLEFQSLHRWHPLIGTRGRVSGMLFETLTKKPISVVQFDKHATRNQVSQWEVTVSLKHFKYCRKIQNAATGTSNASSNRLQTLHLPDSSLKLHNASSTKKGPWTRTQSTANSNPRGDSVSRERRNPFAKPYVQVTIRHLQCRLEPRF